MILQGGSAACAKIRARASGAVMSHQCLGVTKQGWRGAAARQGPVLGSQMQLLGAWTQFLWIMRTPQEL